MADSRAGQQLEAEPGRRVRRLIRQALTQGQVRVKGLLYKGAEIRNLADAGTILRVHQELGYASWGNTMGLGLPEPSTSHVACKSFHAGFCRYGDSCQYVHTDRRLDTGELRRQQGKPTSETSGATGRKKDREQSGFKGCGSSTRSARKRLLEVSKGHNKDGTLPTAPQKCFKIPAGASQTADPEETWTPTKGAPPLGNDRAASSTDDVALHAKPPSVRQCDALIHRTHIWLQADSNAFAFSLLASTNRT